MQLFFIIWCGRGINGYKLTGQVCIPFATKIV